MILHKNVVKTKNKTYEYLLIILSRAIMKNLKPTHVNLSTKPPVVLPVRKRIDGRGYAILPNEITAYFGFVKDQSVEITLTLKN